MNSLFQSFKSSKYLKNIAVLSSGTVIALLIPIAISPILTRLYSPSDFGIFGIFTGILVLSNVLMDGRYSLAITLPKKDSNATKILYLCISVTLFLACIIVLIVGLLFGLSSFINISWLPDWASFIPLIALIVGFTEGFRFYLIRFSKFNDLAKSKLIQSLFLVAGHLIFGFLGFGYWGLILGQFIAYLALLIFLFISIHKFEKLNIITWRSTFNDQFHFAKKYKKFPLFSLPSDGISVFTSQAPVFFLNSFFGSITTGFYSLTNRVLGLPGGTIAKSILEVYKDRASRDYRENGNCKSVFLKTFYLLVGLAVVPLLIILFFGEPIFGFVFGEEWRIAGTYASLLAPLFAFNFIVSPLSYTLIITERQRLDFYLHIIMIVAIIGSLFGSYYWFEDAYFSLATYVVAYCLIYVMYFFVSYRLALGVRHKQGIT